jgi:hypothetical protein
MRGAFDLDRKPTAQCRLCGKDFGPSIVWFWPVSDHCRRPAAASLDLGLFRHFKGVINLNPQVPDCTFKFAVAEQQLYRPQILGSPIDQRRFGPPKSMSTVTCDIQAELLNPRIDDPSILPRG